jgi:protein-disulfide isomerase
MRLNPNLIAVAVVSSLVTLCATIAVIFLVTNVSRVHGLSDAQRVEITRLVTEQTRASNDELLKTIREQSFSDAQRNEIAQVVREHLRSNPDAMHEILAALIKRRMASTPTTPSARPPAPDKSEIIKSNSQTLFHSEHQVTLGNARGDATMVEFFDYNCGFCRRSLADKLALLKDDAKLKIVIKEFPILGPASLEAAKVSIAVRMQDPAGEKFLEFHRKLLASNVRANKANALAVAESVGLDLARLEKDMESDEVITTIDESRRLAQALGINGTPAYVIGNRVVHGAVGLAKLSDAIKSTRN